MAQAHDFWSGLWFWVRGWSYLFRHRTLLMLALMPILISVLAVMVLLTLIWPHLGTWTHALLGTMGVFRVGWLSWLNPLLQFAGSILILIFSVYLIFVLQAVLAVPFYCVLVDRTLAEMNKGRMAFSSLREWLGHSLHMIGIGLIKAFVLLSVGGLLFLLSFVPVLNIFALVGAPLVMAYDCMDYTLDAAGLGLRRRAGYALRNWVQWAGMGAGLALTLVLPGFTFLVTPGAVVGAAIIYKDKES